MELSCIVINFNTKRLSMNCLQSLLAFRGSVEMEIILIDNSTREEERILAYPDSRVKVLANQPNNGFGFACNTGAKEAAGDVLLFLNSDMIANETTIEKPYRYYLNHPEWEVLGIKVVDSNGKIDSGCRRGFPTPLASFAYFLKLDRLFPHSKRLGRYHQTWWNEDEIHEVEAISGSYMMLKRKLFLELGGFDEDFFMYGEDLDLCMRLNEQGAKILYYPEATILHLKGQSGLESKNGFVLFHFYDAMIRFYNKHYKETHSFLINSAVISAVRLKYRLAKRGVRP